MATRSFVLSEDQFLCSICLEVFTDPVATSCGHNFCKICINKHWDNTDQCQCPVCKEEFNTRPHLKINICLSEMASQFKDHPQEDNVITKLTAAEVGDANCDVCPEPKQKALKSCLDCLASYCATHLEPHLTIPRLQRHQLIGPVENLEERICPDHNKVLELFCKDDSKFICLQCTFSDHKCHNAVPLMEVCDKKQVEVKEMIELRRLKIEEMRRTVELSRNNADREVEEGIKVFDTLMECVRKSLQEFKESIEEQHKETEEKANELIEELETEISELEVRRTEMEDLSGSQDHFHFVQTFTSVKPAPNLKDWETVKVRAPSNEGRMAEAVSELENTQLKPEIKKVFQAELKRVQQFAAEVTLDPDTAHPNLVVSKNLKQVHYSDKYLILPENDKRFSHNTCVVAKQKISSGRFYFEVEVKGKTAWYLGIGNELKDRKGKITMNRTYGYWFISLQDNKYKGPDSILDLKSVPQKIGIFVDYEEGLISFYDVDTAALMYSFKNCIFTDDLLPLFNPCGNMNGQNSAPLVITPVST